MTTLRVRCDDVAEVYLNGILVGNTRNMEDIWIERMSNDTHLIAVSCTNGYRSGGLLMSVENVLVSNTKWKCSKNVENVADWYKAEFNDSAWGEAFKIADNDGSIWQKEPSWKQVDFPISAQWIWADENWELPDGAAPETIYCRRKTGKSIIQ